jgi:riboflavin synthase
MFTGIIEEVGRVRRVERTGAGSRVSIEAKRVIEDARNGDSISTDGVCLTALEITREGFEADCSAETLRRTTIGSWREGTPVNLERALRMGDRLGGHLVQGHVDGVGSLVSRRPEGDSQMVRFAFPRELGRHIALKGSIAISGISLTIADLGADWLEIAVIPATLEWTTLGKLAIGSDVNIETDMLAKYVERILGNGRAEAKAGLTVGALEEMGY